MPQPSRRELLALGGLMALHLHRHAGAAESASPFLRGNFAPVHEEVTHDRLRVIGEIPRELSGMFLRNGPNPQFAPRGGYHWFDGDAMLHGVTLRGGAASYRNRYVRTAGWEEERAAGKALYGGLMEPPDPRKLLTGNWKALYKNVANTSLVRHAGRLLALWEGGDPYEVRLPELDTVGPHTFDGCLKHPFTAHPKIDPATGEMFAFGYLPVPPYVQWSHIDAKGKLLATRPLELPRPVMMHDFALTPNYLVFLDLPQVFDLAAMLKGGPVMRFEPRHGARIGLVSRREPAAKPRWFAVEPCFVFHILNAFESGGELVLRACRYPRFPGAFDTTPDPAEAKRPNDPLLYQWRLDLATGGCRESPLDDRPSEFPRQRDTLTGGNARYGYVGLAEGDLFGAFARHDFEKGSSQRHALGAGRFAGEAIFVPRPGGTLEDDGYLMGFVYDSREERSELLIVDARDLTGKPVARVLIPTRVPYGFHAAWLAEEGR